MTKLTLSGNVAIGVLGGHRLPVIPNNILAFGA